MLAKPPSPGLAESLLAVALTTLSAGAFFLALGFFKVGRLIRYTRIP